MRHFRWILEFIAGPIGAPMFMFSMGVGIIYSRNTAPRQMMVRGCKLLRNGYLLSFFKGTLPILVGILAGMTPEFGVWDSLFLVSILQFAGMAFFAIALMKLGRFSLPAMVTVSILACFTGTFLAQFPLPNPGCEYLLGLFYVTDDHVTFPLLTWLYYPVIGMVFATLLQRVTDKKKFYLRCLFIGLCGTGATCAAYTAIGVRITDMFVLCNRVFYHQSIRHYIFTTFVVLAALAIYYFVSEAVTAKPVVTAVSFLGRNLDVIYIVQWLLVCYVLTFMTVIGIPKLSTNTGILVTGLVLTLIACIITQIYLICKKKVGAKKRSTA